MLYELLDELIFLIICGWLASRLIWWIGGLANRPSKAERRWLTEERERMIARGEYITQWHNDHCE